MPPVIQVENLSKLYRLGEVSTGTISHDLNRWWHKVRGKEDPYLKVGQVNDRTKMRKKAENGKAETLKSDSVSAFQHSSISDFSSDYVYALKDINFSVNQGEVLGIIGRNGAGKSTLLKILSRVTAPNSGRIKVKGRIASLLEVGTGFHPELTGRENIYLNGAILGMNRFAITRRLDEIVEFSGCERYLNTPVKRYSSGMYVRLAFAVAAHLDTEILIVDEVLAVGDREFQQKCIGQMSSVTKSGRTVIFVSHNLGSVRQLCNNIILLSNGRLQFAGDTAKGLQKYLQSNQSFMGYRNWVAENELSGNKKVALQSCEIKNENTTTIGEVDASLPILIKIDYVVYTECHGLRFGLQLKTSDGTIAFTTASSTNTEYPEEKTYAGQYEQTCIIPKNLLNSGCYSVLISMDIPFQEIILIEDDCVIFNVHQSDLKIGRFNDKWPGVVSPILEWKRVKLKEELQL